jgi:hypothetical protein
MKRPHVLDMSSPVMVSVCGAHPRPNEPFAWVSPTVHDRAPHLSCPECREALTERSEAVSRQMDAVRVLFHGLWVLVSDMTDDEDLVIISALAADLERMCDERRAQLDAYRTPPTPADIRALWARIDVERS